MIDTAHRPGDCPGLECEDAWHEGGCDPVWTYSTADGTDITGQVYADQTATVKALWSGPDGPDQVWRRSGRGRWTRHN